MPSLPAPLVPIEPVPVPAIAPPRPPLPEPVPVPAPAPEQKLAPPPAPADAPPEPHEPPPEATAPLVAAEPQRSPWPEAEATPEPPAPPGAEAPEPAEPRRVLHVVNGEHYSGAERVQDLLAMALPEFGYEVGFASLKPGRFGDHRRSIESPLFEVSMRGRMDLTAAWRVARVARREKFDLLHAHTPRALMIASLAARMARLPLVYHVHSPASRDSTRWFSNRVNAQVEKLCSRRVSQMITVSPTLTDHMRCLGFPADKLRCVLNGVPAMPEESPCGARRRRQPIAPFVVGMVALFRPRKGTEVLLDAIARVRKRGLDVRLEAIGPFESPEYEEKLYQRAKHLGLSELVHWSGFTDDIPKALSRIDTLALPSLFGEGLPMVVLEAMSAGLPVVATRCEGTSEAILDGESGLLVEPGSVKQMADALEELFGGRSDYVSMSYAAHARHEERFSDRAMARQVASVYDGVLSGVAKR